MEKALNVRECEPLTLEKVQEFMKQGWYLYDTQPVHDNDNAFYLLLIKE